MIPMKYKFFLVVGARPNFMKIAPIYKALLNVTNIEPVIVHTGQHYDERMSKIFFDDLELPNPDIYLGVGSASHAAQTADVMVRFECELLSHKPDVVVLVGDVNSTLACSLTAAKIRYTSPGLTRLWQKYEQYISKRDIEHGTRILTIRAKNSHKRPLIAHVEAGLRSFDSDMPEEVNRTVTDLLSDLLFTTCHDGNENLISEGFDSRKLFFVGNVMIDALKNYLGKANQSDILTQLNNSINSNGKHKLSDHNYALLTLHRPNNVDGADSLKMIIDTLIEVSQHLPIIFPVHPRTRKLLGDLDGGLLDRMQKSDFHLTEPIGYLDFLHLQSKAKLVLTDSGGIQEETSYLGVPCLTLRPNTERPVTIREGTNKLVPLQKEAIVTEVLASLDADGRNPAKIEFWDGHAAARIVSVLTEIISEN